MISIIVPVYNADKYLQSCIRSILEQTRTDFELLLVDDGSSDRSTELCDRFAEDDQRIRVFHTANHGVSHARNIGIEKAEGEYLAFCDADDQYHPDYLKKLTEAADTNQADLVICSYSCCGEDRMISKRDSGIIRKKDIYKSMFLDHTIGGYVWNKLFRRKVIKEIRFEERLEICEDTVFVCRVLQKAAETYYISDSLYRYRIHSGSATGNLRNLFTSEGKLKYSAACEQLIREKIVPGKFRRYVYAGEYLLAAGMKDRCLNAGMLDDSETVSELNRITKKRRLLFWICIGSSMINEMVRTADDLCARRGETLQIWRKRRINTE